MYLGCIRNCLEKAKLLETNKQIAHPVCAEISDRRLNLIHKSFSSAFDPGRLPGGILSTTTTCNTTTAACAFVPQIFLNVKIVQRAYLRTRFITSGELSEEERPTLFRVSISMYLSFLGHISLLKVRTNTRGKHNKHTKQHQPARWSVECRFSADIRTRTIRAVETLPISSDVC